MSDNHDILIGRNPVKEALKSERQLDTIYLQEGISGNIGEIVRLAKNKGVPIKSVPKRKLDEMVAFSEEEQANHQGVVAKAAGVVYKEIEDAFALAEQKGEPVFLIGLDGIEDPHNLGAIVRSAEAFGAHGVLIPKRRSVGMTFTAAKAASGAQEYIPVIRVANLANAIEDIKKRGVFVAAADMDGGPASATNLKGAIMLVVGAEGKGVSRLVKDRADFVVKIPMRGQVASLNASAAAAILMYEKMRQDQS